MLSNCRLCLPDHLVDAIKGLSVFRCGEYDLGSWESRVLDGSPVRLDSPSCST